MQTISVNCEFCGERKSSLIATIRGLKVDRCSRCGLIYTNPRFIWDYAKKSGQLQEELQIFQRYYWPARYQSALKVWDTLKGYRQTGWLLDVGCGFGMFLQEAQSRGWRVMGVEPAEDKVAWAHDNLELAVWPSLKNQELPMGRFDVVTLWDVIEHIPQPLPFLQRCYDLLRPGGLLLIKTPNAEGLLIRTPWWLQSYLFLYRHLVYPANPAEHVFHFTCESLQNLIKKAGFSIVGVDTSQGWGERPITGRNQVILALRHLLMFVAWRLRLPYEIQMLAESSTGNSTA